MEKETRSVQANMLFNTAGSLIYYVSQWLMTILIVKLSGYADAGVLGVAMSATAAPAIVGLFNMRSYQVSDMRGEYSDNVYIRSRMFTNLLSFLICLIVVVCRGYDLEKTAVVLVFMLFKVIEGFADVYYGIDQKMERLDYAGISMAIRGIGSLGFFILGVTLGKSLILGVLLMSVFSLAVVVVYDRSKVRSLSETVRTRQPKQKWSQVKRLLWTCFPLAVVAFLNNLSINQPKLYLEDCFGETIMGFYNSVSSPTVVIQLAATTVFAPLVPLLTIEFEKHHKKEFLGILKKFMVLVAGLTVLCLGAVKLFEVTGFLKWILVTLFNAEIAPYTELFFPVVIISILIAVNACLFSICTLLREIKSQYLIGGVGLVSSYAFTWIFVTNYEMMGVIYALAGTMLLQIMIQLGIIVKRMRRMEEEK